MGRLIINIHDPKKLKDVSDVLIRVGGVKLERAEGGTRKGNSTVKRKLTPKEKRFVVDLRRALKEVNDHIAGKTKLKSAHVFLEEWHEEDKRPVQEAARRSRKT